MHSEASEVTGRKTRLVPVFAGCTGHSVGFVISRLIFQHETTVKILKQLTFEWGHIKTTSGYSEDSAQTAHLCSLISLRSPHEEAVDIQCISETDRKTDLHVHLSLRQAHIIL